MFEGKAVREQMKLKLAAIGGGGEEGRFLVKLCGVAENPRLGIANSCSNRRLCKETTSVSVAHAIHVWATLT